MPFFCVFIANAQKSRDNFAVAYRADLNDTAAANTYLIKHTAGTKPIYGKILKVIDAEHYIISSDEQIIFNKNVLSAEKANNLWKASDELVSTLQKHPSQTKPVTLLLRQDDSKLIERLKGSGTILSQLKNQVTINLKLRDLTKILAEKDIAFAFTPRKAKEELVINDIDLGVNSISAVADNFTDLNGSGINVCVKENKYDDDLDLLGRSFSSFPAAAFTTGHATTMATLIGGNGNSFIKGLGAAPQVRFTSSDFANLSPDSISTFKKYNVYLQNHSYGTGIENFYGLEAVQYDDQIYHNDSVVHVFSAGNIGTTQPQTGLYTSLTAANLSGTFKQAKNVIVVGGTDRKNIYQNLSSAGPTYDGRLKPELVADGEDGTSGAAALVSGTVALMQQQYKKQYKSMPSAALIKSVLINSADDIGTLHPDYQTGYGKLNALEAVRTISDGRVISGNINNNQQQNYTITVPAQCALLKVSMAWNDPPAEINAASALVNDLNLTITTPDGKLIHPWVLSTYPATDSLNAVAKQGIDSLNNTEQVTIQNPVAGTYTIHVTGKIKNATSQAFYIAHQETIANKFEWTYPSGNDQLFDDDDNYLRWQSSFSPASGKISVSYDNGLNWTELASANLNDGYYVWNAPDVFTKAILKMDVNGQSYISKPFTISKPLTIDVGYNCTDGTQLHWNPQPGSSAYTIYSIKDNVLTKLTTAADTMIVIPSAQQTSAYFAVSAQGDGFEGLKSYTINATTQGVGCYVRNLIANVQNNQIVLSLQIGTTTGLQTITWEKLGPLNQYKPIGSTTASQSLDYTFTDPSPQKGTNYYRTRFTTIDGKNYYSDIANATFLSDNQFVVYPNPVSSQVNIISGSINNYEFKLYDTTGKLYITRTLDNLQNSFQINVSPGLYVYTIRLNGKTIYSGKLIKI
ncbi:S8 family peptidase [Mucilaginibacter sp. KACC 22063]|uniref:S8 family peptidase n=1 Tax=Mucilaginibacter sp. KACC 22063 TaxID=3025666 RepID=UPI002365DB76|nr:S8 family peptidase [Mucilaginibacter sp. KACC 22063]WDF53994.1 S8 family peptidase [Mucilaginibacter sp. KACC 22063]